MRTQYSIFAGALVLVVVAFALQLRRDSSRATSASIGLERAAADALETAPYKAAKWRLAVSELDRTLLSVSHILIRHGECDRQEPFGPPGWNALPPPPHRTRTEALTKARDIARAVKSRSQDFEVLAREESDDVVTSQQGGSLGLVRADIFLMYPQVLDALAAIRIGESTRVIETLHGFHVFKRREIPPRQSVTGRQVVIGYSDAPWLKGEARPLRATPTRTRADAMGIAKAVAAQLRRDSSRIEAIVEEYSEHRSAILGGSIGTWSTHEIGPYERERAALAVLRPGEVSEPIDTHHGVKILVRTDASGDQAFETRAIRIKYRRSPTSALPTEDGARALASSIRKDLLKHAGKFSELQSRYCCLGTIQWTHGQQSDPVSLAVETVGVGQMVGPIVDDSAYVVAERLPVSSPKPPVLFELSCPDAPDLVALARTGSGEPSARLVRTIADELSLTLSLDAKRATEFRGLHSRLAQVYEQSELGVSRDHAVALFFAALKRLLTTAEYDAYTSRVQSLLFSRLMQRYQSARN